MRAAPFFAGLLIWAMLLFGGVLWSLSPMWITQNVPETIEEARAAIPFHLARLESTKFSGHAERVAREDAAPPAEFDFMDWAVREITARGILVVIIWTMLGFVMRWFLGQIIRGWRTWS
jgi:hypothetical protein